MYVNMYIQWAVPTINVLNMYIQWAVPTINTRKHVYPVSSAYY